MCVVDDPLISAKRRAGFLKEDGNSLKEIVNKASMVGKIVGTTTIYKHHVCMLSIEHLFISLFDTTFAGMDQRTSP